MFVIGVVVVCLGIIILFDLPYDSPVRDRWIVAALLAIAMGLTTVALDRMLP